MFVLEAFLDHNCGSGTIQVAGVAKPLDQFRPLQSFHDALFAIKADFEFNIGGQIFNRLWLMVDK